MRPACFTGGDGFGSWRAGHCQLMLVVMVLALVFFGKRDDFLRRRVSVQRRKRMAGENVMNCSKQMKANKPLLPSKDCEPFGIKINSMLIKEHLHYRKEFRLFRRFVRRSVKLFHVVAYPQHARNIIALISKLVRYAADSDVFIVPHNAPISAMA